MITRRLVRPSGSSISSLWTCSACTQTKVTRQWPDSSTLSPLHNATQRRGIKSPPKLSFEDSFTEHGVPGLFSQDGYRLAWTEYQKIIVEKANALTAGDSYDDHTPKELVLRFARDPMNASLFNHASMAFNNHFFFSTLAPAPTRLEQCPSLAHSLVRTFGSIENLRSTMLEQAAGMFGPGFVWLVWARDIADPNLNTAAHPSRFRNTSNRNGRWRLLNTYLAGTPFPEAGYRQQSIDTASASPGSYNSYLIEQPAYLVEKHREQREREELEAKQQEIIGNKDLPTSDPTAMAAYAQQPVNNVGSFGAHSRFGKQVARLPPGGTNLMPVLCVNTWEHVWLYDYGIGGKRRYLDDWWAAVDWGAVEANAPQEAKEVPKDGSIFEHY